MTTAVLIGSPNSGKSLLFNRLTGLHQKVANFPGITVDVTEGALLHVPDARLLDFPGTYSLHAISREEQIAVDNFHRLMADPELSAVLCIIDSTRMEKSLHFALQVIRECHRSGKQVVVLANMIDVLHEYDMNLDAPALSARLGVPVLPLSGRTGEGLPALEQALGTLDASAAQATASFAEASDTELHDLAVELAAEYGMNGEVLVRNQTRIDAFFLHSVFGGFVFVAIMYLLFQSIFTWAAPAMDAIQGSIGWLADQVVPLIGWAPLRDFMSDAVFSGLGAFLVFVPQIFVLTLVVGIMEDSGYMARAALICHRPLRAFGLTGKSFVPMLSGVACAIPAIYAARSIDSPRKRFLTYLAIPLMPCSARLPVYTLLIATFIPADTALGGLIGLQGLAMFLVYFFGMAVGMIVTSIVSRVTSDPDQDLPFILEMPPYRLPSWRPLLRHAWNRAKHFITKAGVVIFWVTVTVWFLGYFPNYGADLGQSYLGNLGRLIDPLFQPMGLDWRYAVAILSSFLAREVFVGTLGTMFGIEGADENFVPLVDQIRDSGLTIGSGFALLVFFAVALQCVSTLALLRTESGSRRLPAQMFAAYGALAYVLALITYHLVNALA